MKLQILAPLALAVLSTTAFALEIPYLSGHVNDDAQLIDAATANRLDQTLKDYEKRTGHQIVVLIVPSLDGAVLEDYSIKVARTWKLGQKGKDDGILLFIARDDHKMRIEVGYGLEAVLPDAMCGRIIRGEITPRFRNGDFAGGITAGVNAILGTIDGSYSPPLLAETSGPRLRQGHNDFAQMGILEKLLTSCFVFSILGIFECLGIAIPGFGWFLYFFLIPFWAAFPMAIWGAKIGLALLGTHLVGFPILKLILPRTNWGQNIIKNMHSGNRGVYMGGSGGFSSGSSGGGFGGGGFSGGGGSFGGGGSSGGW